jgi:hypothetical protein
MEYKRITVELVVFSDEAEAVGAELTAALDRLEEKHTLFGGDVETVPCEHPVARRRSALGHTLAGLGKAADGLKIARKSVGVAIRAVI